MVTWSFIWVAFGGACGAVIFYIVGSSIGFLGGFTTFSVFSLYTLKLYQDDRVLAAGGYIVASVFLSLLALTILYLAQIEARLK